MFLDEDGVNKWVADTVYQVILEVKALHGVDQALVDEIEHALEHAKDYSCCGDPTCAVQKIGQVGMQVAIQDRFPDLIVNAVNRAFNIMNEKMVNYDHT